jgi:hypothetical protein
MIPNDPDFRLLNRVRRRCSFGISDAMGIGLSGGGQRADLDLEFLSNRGLDSRITFTRGSAGTRVNSSGLIESITTNNPRFDHDPVTLAAKGLLVEEARANLLTYSQAFQDAAWGRSNATPVDNAVASPDGTTNATTITWASTGYPSLFRTVTTANSTAHVLSVFAKAGNTSVFTLELRGASGSVYDFEFSLSGAGTATINGSAVGSPTGGIEQFPNGWYRCWIVKTTTNTTPVVIIGKNVGVAGQTVHIWQADLQAGAFRTSPIPTVASTVTRSADVASMTGSAFSGWFNASEGTILSEFDTYGSSAASRSVALLSDAAENNYIQCNANGSNKMTLRVASGGSTVANLQSVATVTANTIYRQAGTYKADDFAQSFAGATPLTDTAGEVPVSMDRLTIGGTTSGGEKLNGHIRLLRYYRTRLGNAALQSLSA